MAKARKFDTQVGFYPSKPLVSPPKNLTHKKAHRPIDVGKLSASSSHEEEKFKTFKQVDLKAHAPFVALVDRDLIQKERRKKVIENSIDQELFKVKMQTDIKCETILNGFRASKPIKGSIKSRSPTNCFDPPSLQPKINREKLLKSVDLTRKDNAQHAYDQLYITRKVFEKYKTTETRLRDQIGDTGTTRRDGYPYVMQ